MNANIAEQADRLPEYLANHLEITIVALLVGILTTVPLAIVLVRRPRLRDPVMTVAGAIQTIPSLALLALMVPLLAKTNGLGVGISAFGFFPAVIALTLYSVLPVLRNTVTGILGVDASLIEAAHGVGMTRRQILTKVELPLAAPVIIAGIRTATVWVVGIATLATPVGQTCLGNYIFTGLQTKNWTMVMFGVVSAAALAITLDVLIGSLERAASERRRTRGIVAGATLAVIVVVGLTSPSIVDALRAPPRAGAVAVEASSKTAITRVTVGAKTFTEQYILAKLIGDELRAHGLEVDVAGSLGSTVAFDALESGELDMYVDYSGTIWSSYMGETESPAPWKVLAEVEGWLAREHGIRSLGSLGFENAYALAVRRETAEKLGLHSIADLTAHAHEMSIGGDYEIFGRPEWDAIRAAYGLRFARQRSFDSTLMYDALAAGKVDVIAAFSSDGRLTEYDLVVLEDPAHVIPPYHALLLLGPRVADSDRVALALRDLVGAIPVDLMRRANFMVDRVRDKRTIAEAASWLRKEIASRSEE